MEKNYFINTMVVQKSRSSNRCAYVTDERVHIAKCATKYCRK